MKKNLIILLLIPFLIALLGVVTINTTFNLIENDIVGINWDYEDFEVFENNKEYLLEAEGINEKNYPASKGNNLIWSIKNRDSNDTNVYGEIILKGTFYYLVTKNPGEVIITCSNEKGNVFKTMSAIIYQAGTSVIIVQNKNKSSQNNIDPTLYYGEYDLVDNKKVKASFEFDIKVVPENNGSELFIESKSDNISVDLKARKVTINKAGKSYFTVNGTKAVNEMQSMTYSFDVVDEGVNVYSYSDLLYCTNNSKNGEVVVLRKSFESLDYILDNKDDSTVCFGNYNSKTNKFNFENEVYKFTTTYNKNYIDQWNNYIRSNNGNNFVTDQIIVGLRVQKDFYGNGYTINMHNLTFPTNEIILETENGQIKVPELSNDDLFRGPRPFYALGDPSNMPLVEAFGQDNIGMYVDGDNILINDINLRNCDFGNMVSNLNTVGTVLETNGNNITISNSRLSNGKNVIRSFSSMNTIIKNSLLSNSRNFLISLGTNEYIEVDTSSEYSFTDLNNRPVKSRIDSYLKIDGLGDDVLNAYMNGDFTDKEVMRKALTSIQDALNQKQLVEGNYKGSMIVEDTLFYRSGIASIALESMFNGPFLSNSAPSAIADILKMLSTNDGTSLDKLQFNHLAGMSYPVYLTLKGSTKFYDYKTADQIDMNGLINENISSFAASIQPDYQGIITIDKIFPIKTYLMEQANKNNQIYNGHVNCPIAYYGGGLNASVVNLDSLDCKDQLGKELSIDFMDAYLELGKGNGTIEMLKNMMLKSVVVVTGTEPFKFVLTKGNGYLYNETPKVLELIENAKGE